MAVSSGWALVLCVSQGMYPFHQAVEIIGIKVFNKCFSYYYFCVCRISNNIITFIYGIVYFSFHLVKLPKYVNFTDFFSKNWLWLHWFSSIIFYCIDFHPNPSFCLLWVSFALLFLICFVCVCVHVTIVFNVEIGVTDSRSLFKKIGVQSYKFLLSTALMTFQIIPMH